MAKILIVEDDEIMGGVIKNYLTARNHVIDWAEEGSLALEYLRSFEYDVIILDWQLPEVDGLTICQRFRASGGQTPVIMLTALNSIENKEEGLYSGADDYLTKPFDIRELNARITTLLRRPAQYAGMTLKAGNITMETQKKRVTREGTELRLQPFEYAVLEYFMRHPNQTVSAEFLLSSVTNADIEGSLDSLYSCLNRLRKKIDPSNKEALIRTEHGYGYRLVPPQENRLCSLE